MTLRKLTVPIVLAGLAALSGCTTAPATKPAEPGKAEPSQPVSRATAANMAHNCFACHGPDGVSPGAIPSLRHLKAESIVATMKAFRSGERPSTVMGRHAKGYSDTEVEAIASYIASLQRK